MHITANHLKCLAGVAAISALVTTQAAAGVLYAGESSGYGYLTTVNRNTGDQTVVGRHDPDQTIGQPGSSGMDYDADNDMLYMVSRAPWNKGLYSINRSNGLATPIGPTAFDSYFGDADPIGLVYDRASGSLFSAIAGSTQMVAINPATGVPTVHTIFANFNTVSALAYDPAGDLYAIGRMNDDRALIRFDPLTGVGESIITLAGSTHSYHSLTWDPKNDVFWTFNNDNDTLVMLDPLAGTETAGPQVSALTVDQGYPIGSPPHTTLQGLVYIVPSPSTLVAFGLAPALLGGRRRKGGSR